MQSGSNEIFKIGRNDDQAHERDISLSSLNNSNPNRVLRHGSTLSPAEHNNNTSGTSDDASKLFLTNEDTTGMTSFASLSMDERSRDGAGRTAGGLYLNMENDQGFRKHYIMPIVSNNQC